jgi:hypothetical protein
MSDPAQRTEHDDVTTRDYLAPRINVPEDDHRVLGLDLLSGAHHPMDDPRIGVIPESTIAREGCARLI